MGLGSGRGRLAPVLGAALFFTPACKADPMLLVDLRTDLVPGVEFDQIRVDLLASRERGAEPLRSGNLTAARGDDFVEARRVAEWRGMKRGSYLVRLRLLRPNVDPVTERYVALTLNRSTGVTVVITRDCTLVACPAPDGDPTMLACLAGSCVDDRCTPESPEFCPDPECTSDDACAATTDCAATRCVDGVCLADTSGSTCDVNEWCNPDIGCEPTTILKWESVVTHGADVGEVALLMNAVGTSSEPRIMGVSKLRVTFTLPIDPSTATPSSVQLAGRDVDASTVDLSGHSITGSLSGGNRVLDIAITPKLPDRAKYRAALVGITGEEGLPAGGALDILLTALVGDTTEDRRVNSADLGGLRSFIGTEPMDPTNRRQVRSDLDADGHITEADMDTGRSQVGIDARFIADP